MKAKRSDMIGGLIKVLYKKEHKPEQAYSDDEISEKIKHLHKVSAESIALEMRSFANLKAMCCPDCGSIALYISRKCPRGKGRYITCQFCDNSRLEVGDVGSALVARYFINEKGVTVDNAAPKLYPIPYKIDKRRKGKSLPL